MHSSSSSPVAGLPTLHLFAGATEMGGVSSTRLSDVASILESKGFLDGTESFYPSCCSLPIRYEEDDPTTGRKFIIREFPPIYSDGTKRLVLRSLHFPDEPLLYQSQILLWEMLNAEGSIASTQYIPDFLSFDTHRVALLSFVVALALNPATDLSTSRVAFLGVGGGAMPAFMQHHFPSIFIECAEIDPAVVSIAKRYFGFTETPKCRVHIVDALDLIASRSIGKQKYNFVFLDIDSSDKTLEAPPKSFITPQTLQSIRDCLAPQGILAMTIITDYRRTFMAVVGKLVRVFGCVWTVQVDESGWIAFVCKGVDANTEAIPTMLQLQEAEKTFTNMCGLNRKLCDLAPYVSKLVTHSKPALPLPSKMSLRSGGH